MRFWKSKTPTSMATKSASFFLAGTSLNSMLVNSNYNALAGEGYAANAVAYACINKIANACASVELKLSRKTKDGKREPVTDHPLLDLLDRPNPTQSGDEFFRHMTAYYLLSGNMYLLGTNSDAKRPPLELVLLNPGNVKVVPGDSIFPKAYEYRTTAKTTSYPVDQISGRSQVMHLKTFNPIDPWVGLSPLVAAAYDIDIHNGSKRWNKRLLDNDARPSGALVVSDADGKPATLTVEQYTRLKEQIEQNFSGASNAGKPMLLEGGLDWKEMSLNARDMDFTEGKNSAARDIGLAYGVPPQLLGIKGDSTFANMEQATLGFWNDTVLPLLKLEIEALNRWLVPMYGPGLQLWYDEDEISALEPLRRAKAERINNSGYMTVNEKRRAMGFEDVQGGDVVFVPSSNIPLDLAGSMDLPEPGSAATQP